MHTLNPTAASVWMQCDGQTTLDGIAARLSPDVPGAARDALVRLTLRELDEARLLVPMPSADPQLSRRELIRRAGVAAILLPVVSSIVAPTPLDAQSANSRTFDFTGAAQSFTVPAGVTRITVAAYGASGGTSLSLGGKGGLVTATLPVTAGETLSVFVGGAAEAGPR